MEARRRAGRQAGRRTEAEAPPAHKRQSRQKERLLSGFVCVCVCVQERCRAREGGLYMLGRERCGRCVVRIWRGARTANLDRCLQL